jgi:hypothetical protein
MERMTDADAKALLNILASDRLPVVSTARRQAVILHALQAIEERAALVEAAGTRHLADERDALIERYQHCTQRLWQLFPRDPLPADDPAQGWIQRLEALLNRGLLAPLAPRPTYSIPALPTDAAADALVARYQAASREPLPRCVGVVAGNCPAPQIRCHQGCIYANDRGEPQFTHDGLRSWASWEVVGIGPVNLGSGLAGPGAQADYESGRKRLVMRQGFVLDLVPADYQLQEHEQFVAVERVTKHESWPTPR